MDSNDYVNSARGKIRIIKKIECKILAGISPSRYVKMWTGNTAQTNFRCIQSGCAEEQTSFIELVRVEEDFLF